MSYEEGSGDPSLSLYGDFKPETRGEHLDDVVNSYITRTINGLITPVGFRGMRAPSDVPMITSTGEKFLRISKRTGPALEGVALNDTINVTDLKPEESLFSSINVDYDSYRARKDKRTYQILAHTCIAHFMIDGQEDDLGITYNRNSTKGNSSVEFDWPELDWAPLRVKGGEAPTLAEMSPKFRNITMEMVRSLHLIEKLAHGKLFKQPGRADHPSASSTPYLWKDPHHKPNGIVARKLDERAVKGYITDDGTIG